MSLDHGMLTFLIAILLCRNVVVSFPFYVMSDTQMSGQCILLMAAIMIMLSDMVSSL